MSPKPSALTVIGKDITLSNVLKTRCKKQVLVSATYTLVTKTRKKAIETAGIAKTVGISKNNKESKGGRYPGNLAQIPYIQYFITFWKRSVPMMALFDCGSEINAIYPTFAQELGLFIKSTDVGAQKIDGTT